jgi:hypothetical protein
LVAFNCKALEADIDRIKNFVSDRIGRDAGNH